MLNFKMTEFSCRFILNLIGQNNTIQPSPIQTSYTDILWLEIVNIYSTTQHNTLSYAAQVQIYSPYHSLSFSNMFLSIKFVKNLDRLYFSFSPSDNDCQFLIKYVNVCSVLHNPSDTELN